MSNSNYYARKPLVHIDGTPIFKSEEDEQNEREVASIIERSWGCRLGSFGRLSPIDWYAVRDERLVGLLELKSRSHDVNTYPTVFLNMRKWFALMLAMVATGVPAVFVVKFTDDIRWIRIMDVPAYNIRMGGLTHTVKSRNDIEPVLEVPIDLMTSIKNLPGTVA